MIGSHFIKGWARTQNHVTLSAADAELVAPVKCSAELLGANGMMRYLGVEKGGVIYADSSAALAIAKRKGAGVEANQHQLSLDPRATGFKTVIAAQSPWG